MKNFLLPILLFVFCLNTGNSFANCNSTIDDLSLGSYSSYNLNIHFSGTPGPDFMYYEFDLYVNDVYQSTSIETNPNAITSSLTSSMDMLTACLIEIKARTRCINGDSGPELEITLTIDELWDCIDFGNLCNSNTRKIYNDDNNEGLLTEYLVPCLCSITGFQQGNNEERKDYVKNKKNNLKISAERINANVGDETEFGPCTKFTKKWAMENGPGEAKRGDGYGLQDIKLESIYPNPSIGRVFIDSKLISKLEVLNLIGKKIPYTISKNEIIIDDKTKGLLIFKSSYNGIPFIEKVFVK